MPAVKKTVAKPAAKPSAKPAAAKKPAAKKGGALEIAPIAATGLLLVAQKMYKEMMAEEAKRPASAAAKRTRKTRRGGLGPNGEISDLSHPIDTSAEEDAAEEPAAPGETAAPSETAAEELAPAPAPATAELMPAPEVEPVVAEEAASNPTLVDAAATVINNMNDEDKSKLKGMLGCKEEEMVGGAKKARKPSAKRGGSAGIVGAELQAATAMPLAGGAKKARKPSAKKSGGGEVNAVMPLAGGSELSMPAPLAGGAKKARKPSAKKSGGGEIAPVAAIAGGSELSMPAPLAGGAKKASRKPSAKRGGGALAPTAEVAGGMPLAPANTAPVYVERTSPMAGGAKKAAAKPAAKKRMAGGELAAYTAQLDKLTSQLRTLM